MCARLVFYIPFRVIYSRLPFWGIVLSQRSRIVSVLRTDRSWVFFFVIIYCRYARINCCVNSDRTQLCNKTSATTRCARKTSGSRVGDYTAPAILLTLWNRRVVWIRRPGDFLCFFFVVGIALTRPMIVASLLLVWSKQILHSNAV